MSGSYPCLCQIQISTMFKNSAICIGFTHHRPGKNAQHYWSSLKHPQIKAWEEGQKRPERSESTNLERVADTPQAPSLLRYSASPLDGARATNTRQVQPLLRHHSASLMRIWNTLMKYKEDKAFNLLMNYLLTKLHIYKPNYTLRSRIESPNTFLPIEHCTKVSINSAFTFI